MSNVPVLEEALKKCPWCGDAAEVRATNIHARVCCPNESCTVRPTTSLYKSIQAACYYWNERKEI